MTVSWSAMAGGGGQPPPRRALPPPARRGGDALARSRGTPPPPGPRAQRGELSQAPAMLYRSYMHLHLNRLVGIDGTAEPRVLGLLLRTREGLARAPQVPVPDPPAGGSRAMNGAPVGME